MSWPAIIFVVLPCLAASALGWAIPHWTLAAAALAGAAATFLLLEAIAAPFRSLVLPFLTGAVTGSLVLIPILLYRPTAAVWTRMSGALLVTFVLHFWLLQAVFTQIP